MSVWNYQMRFKNLELDQSSTNSTQNISETNSHFSNQISGKKKFGMVSACMKQCADFKIRFVIRFEFITVRIVGNRSKCFEVSVKRLSDLIGIRGG